MDVNTLCMSISLSLPLSPLSPFSPLSPALSLISPSLSHLSISLPPTLPLTLTLSPLSSLSPSLFPLPLSCSLTVPANDMNPTFTQTPEERLLEIKGKDYQKIKKYIKTTRKEAIRKPKSPK